LFLKKFRPITVGTQDKTTFSYFAGYISHLHRMRAA